MHRNSLHPFALWGIFLSVCIHLFFGFYLNFSVDEAHYALYGLFLDWSYFDHPPLVGWVQYLPVHWNFSVGLIRFLLPEMIWLISIVICMSLTSLILESFFYHPNDVHFQSAPWWTAISIVCAPILHVLGVGLLPDTLLLIIVPSLMWLTIQLHLKLGNRHPKDFLLWILLGLVLGFAALAKYTSIFFALAIPFCLLSWHGLKTFRRPGFWFSLLIAGVLTIPIIYWNAQHDWISFSYQFAHGSGGEWKFRRLGTFLLNQLLSFGPLILLGVIWNYRRHLNSPFQLKLFFLIPFGIFLYFSGGGSSLPHWTSPAWIALSPIAGIGLAHAWSLGRKFWIKAVLFLQISICLLGFGLLFTGGLPNVSMQDELGQKNPIADLYGWQEAGEKMRTLAKEYQIEHLVVQNWTLGSRLAWYAKPLAVHVLDDRVDQFDLWFGKLPEQSDALLLNWSQMSFADPVKPGGFERCEKIDTFIVHHLKRDIAQFDFILCKNWGGKSSPIRNAFDFTIKQNIIQPTSIIEVKPLP